MNGIHEVMGSIPISSTNSSNNLAEGGGTLVRKLGGSSVGRDIRAIRTSFSSIQGT